MQVEIQNFKRFFKCFLEWTNCYSHKERSYPRQYTSWIDFAQSPKRDPKFEAFEYRERQNNRVIKKINRSQNDSLYFAVEIEETRGRNLCIEKSD